MSDLADTHGSKARGPILLAIIVMLAVLVSTPFLFPKPATVTIKNAGGRAMHDVVIHVTGNRHEVGEIPAGAEHTEPLHPSGETSVRISFEDPPGKPRSVDINCYLEPRYTGDLRVEITDGDVTKTIDRTNFR